MMRDTTWMDAGAALQDGFIDGIVDMGQRHHQTLPFCHETSLAEAKAKVAAWMERSRPKRIRNADKQKDAEAEVAPVIAAQQAEPQSLKNPNRPSRSGKLPRRHSPQLRPAFPQPSCKAAGADHTDQTMTRRRKAV